MAFVCGISGEVPEVPVVSIKSGEVFEQRLLEQYVKEHSKHPVTGQECSLEDFVTMSKTLHVQPRVPTQTSIPSIIKLMQDEWDAMNIENYTLRQQLQQTRQELSRALYQHDAACRVIARLTRERDQARHIAQDLNPGAAMQAEQNAQKQANGNSSAMEVDGAANGSGAGKLNAELVAAIKKKNEELCMWRKQRETDAELADKESFSSYAIKASFPGLHGSKGNAVTAMGLVTADSDKIVSGGNDKSVVVYSQKDNKIVHKFKSAHSKKVTGVLHHPSKSIVYSCGADKHVKILDVETKKEIASVKPHTGEVTSLDMHPTGLCYLSTSLDGSWALVDEASNEVLMREEGLSRLTCGKFHPDGLYMATGAENGEVLIWDMERQEVAHKFDGHASAVCSMSFSGTGRYFATSAVDGVVKIWDLVKLNSIHTIEADGDAKVNTLAFDESGQYLVTGGTQVNVYVVKKKSLPLVHSFTDVPEVSSVHFGPHAKTIVAACVDRSIKVLGA